MTDSHTDDLHWKAGRVLSRAATACIEQINYLMRRDRFRAVVGLRA